MYRPEIIPPTQAVEFTIWFEMIDHSSTHTVISQTCTFCNFSFRGLFFHKEQTTQIMEKKWVSLRTILSSFQWSRTYSKKILSLYKEDFVPLCSNLTWRILCIKAIWLLLSQGRKNWILNSLTLILQSTHTNKSKRRFMLVVGDYDTDTTREQEQIKIQICRNKWKRTRERKCKVLNWYQFTTNSSSAYLSKDCR